MQPTGYPTGYHDFGLTAQWANPGSVVFPTPGHPAMHPHPYHPLMTPRTPFPFYLNMSPEEIDKRNKEAAMIAAQEQQRVVDEQKSYRPYVKKPLNAFMLFMKENREKVMQESTLKESAAINQILGRKVKNTQCFHDFFVFIQIFFLPQIVLLSSSEISMVSVFFELLILFWFARPRLFCLELRWCQLVWHCQKLGFAGLFALKSDH